MMMMMAVTMMSLSHNQKKNKQDECTATHQKLTNDEQRQLTAARANLMTILTLWRKR